jgi:tetratricopeptide (TPR) repeat protein
MFKTKGIKDVENYVIDSLVDAQKSGDVAAVLAIANELGGIYRVTNRLEEAKKIYQVAIEAIKLMGLENTQQHGTTLLNLASVYSEGKDFSEALKLYEMVAVIFEGAGLSNDYRMAALYNNISHVYDELLQEDKAVENAEKSLNIIKKLPDCETELATTYTTLACRYMKKQRYKEAEQNLLMAEKIFLRQDGKVDVHYAATLTAMGELYYHEGNYNMAAKYFEQALKHIKDNYGQNTAYETVRKNLEQVYEKIENIPNPINVASVSEKSADRVSDSRISGLELSEAYYNAYGKQLLKEKFPEYEKYAAVGLIGEGSECFGFDDSFSEDHDFGPGFCIWLPDDIFQNVGMQMQQTYDSLPKNFKNKCRIETPEGRGRTGIFSTGEFYKKYIGGMPNSNIEWLLIPESNLCTATNGKIFEDNLGEFSAIRNELLKFYPKDIFLKKLVARLAIMSQSGQYNYERCMKRGEFAAAYLACSEFVKTTVSAVYLLNRKYMPFYKWMFRGMNELVILSEVKRILECLISIADIPENTAKKVELIEEICVLVRKELNRQEIVMGTDDFLQNHCYPIMNSISDAQIRNLPIMYDVK